MAPPRIDDEDVAALPALATPHKRQRTDNLQHCIQGGARHDGCAHFAAAAALHTQQLRAKLNALAPASATPTTSSETPTALSDTAQLEVEHLERCDQTSLPRSSLCDELYACLACSFTGKREPASYTHDNSSKPATTDSSDSDDVDSRCFMAHAIVHDHPFALLVRKQQLFCANCCAFIYPTALHSAVTATVSQTAATSIAPMDSIGVMTPLLTPRGLVNMGNTSYVNVVLQALAHMRLLQHSFIIANRHSPMLCQQTRRLHHRQQTLKAPVEAGEPSTDKVDKSDDASLPLCLWCTLEALIAALTSLSPSPPASAEHSKLPPVVPHALLTAFYSSSSSAATTKQHDALSFYRALLMSLHTHTFDYKRPTNSQGTQGPSSTTRNSTDNSNKTAELSCPNTASQCDCVMHEHFTGVSVIEVICTVCEQVTRTFESFTDLSLTLNIAKENDTTGDADGVSLRSLVQHMTADEKLRGVNRVYCRMCTAYNNMTKRLRFTQLPNVLVVHLERSNGNGNKQQKKKQKRMVFPLTELTLDAFMAVAVDEEEREKEEEIDSDTATNEVFDLAAVMTHRNDDSDAVDGSGGHFTAFVQIATTTASQWWHLDDVTVTPATEDQVQESKAHMLFYVKRRPTLLVV